MKTQVARLQLSKMWAASWTMKSAKGPFLEKYAAETKHVVSSLMPGASSASNSAPTLATYRFARVQVTARDSKEERYVIPYVPLWLCAGASVLRQEGEGVE
jgi:hypothetical protein